MRVADSKLKVCRKEQVRQSTITTQCGGCADIWIARLDLVGAHQRVLSKELLSETLKEAFCFNGRLRLTCVWGAPIASGAWHWFEVSLLRCGVSAIE